MIPPAATISRNFIWLESGGSPVSVAAKAMTGHSVMPAVMKSERFMNWVAL